VGLHRPGMTGRVSSACACATAAAAWLFEGAAAGGS
jgi:hypothetical protein